jgi:ubiquitin carboxyl-terminal hydrolase 25/28
VQLADLSFFNEEIEATIRRASIASPSGPPKNLFGPDAPLLTSPSKVAQKPILEDVEMEDEPVGKDPETASNASEATLVDMDSPQTLPASDQDLDLEKMKQDPVVEVAKQDDAEMINADTQKGLGTLSPPPDKPPPIPPRNKNGLSLSTIKSDKVVPNNDRWQLGTQQDVDEVIRNTTWRLMCAIKPTGTDSISGEQSDKIRDTFYGDTATYLRKESKVERKVESWSSLLVYASEKKAIDIYEAIDLTLDKQMVEVDKGEVPQFSSITKLPPILQIQINRTVYDKIKKQSVKVKGAVNFPETIFLDRYMDSSDLASPLMQRREEGWRMKAELQKLESRVEALQNSSIVETDDVQQSTRSKDGAASLTVAESLNHLKDLVTGFEDAGIDDLDISDDIPALIDEKILNIGLELENVQQRIDTLKRKLAEQFTDMRQYEYKLQAVFIHRGTAGAGHYWIYIYDFKNDIWREYNDERVEIVNNRKRIFDSQEQEGATPYYLVYVRASDREPVCRKPKAPEEAVELRDTEMNDNEDWEDINDNDTGNGGEMEDVEEVMHVEHVKPKPLRPKAPTKEWEQKLEEPGRDANGNMW